MAFAGTPIIEYMNRVKYPYNISTATQQLALEALQNISTVNDWIEVTVTEREWLRNALTSLRYVVEIYPSDANFLLVKMNSARQVYEYLSDRGIIVRDRSRVILCDDCLRITVGTPDENRLLMDTLAQYK